ncbi:MAG: hypothetical protein IT260_09990 [Saprospiraceae bacterium]|nr:hypothetical protein [Saprospiraceae bacterium]
MTDNSLIMNGETETSVSADQLTGWLKNLDRHGQELLGAIQQGRVKVTSTAGFSEIAARLRESTRAYADEAFKVSELTGQKVILTNAIFYLLKSCERIAGHADKIGELMAVLPLGEALDAKTILGILLDGKKRDTLIDNGKLLAGAFEGSWLGRIEVNALAPILAEAGIDFTAYAHFVEVLKKHLPEEPKTQLPNG